MEKAVSGPLDEVYQLAADMGGMGFIHSAETEIMRNSVLININMTHTAAEVGIPRYFFSSSVCIYRDMQPEEPEMTEEEAFPALPDNEYGWEKLYSERMALAYGCRYGVQVRIARFQNCYGPEGTWRGGRVTWDTAKPNGQPRRKLDTIRAFHEFGFQAQTTFNAGLSVTIKWYQELRKNAEKIKPGLDD